ncbi:MAG TPA: ChaN family lipoprotein [Myxococcota bacterium]|nr:ChaN family lipoprotein [Myxococcota bacterium]
MTRAGVALPLLVLLLGCASGAGGPARPAIAWQAAHGREHPLAGRIRDVAAERWIDEDALLDALARADLVLLGERHDHPDHHALQERILAAMVARGRRPAVAFEMLDAADAPAVAAAVAPGAGAGPGTGPREPAARAEALREAVAWDESGWPDWALYAPVFEAALAADLPIVPANLTRTELHALGRGGPSALPATRRAALGLDAPADPDERRALLEQIREVHCGHAPEAALERMVDVQRAWNAQLARALADAARPPPTGVGSGAVLIAGNEHVRRDRGAPRWLARFAPDARVASVGLVELDPEQPDATPEPDAPFDYVWLTPRIDLVDPCEKYRESLEQLRRR